MRRNIVVGTVLCLVFVLCASAQDKGAMAPAEKPNTETKKEAKMNPVVVMKTSMGTIKIELLE